MATKKSTKATAAKKTKQAKPASKPKKATAVKKATRAKPATNAKKAAAAKKTTRAKPAKSAKKTTGAKAAGTKRATKSTKAAARKRPLPRSAEPQVTDIPGGGEAILTPDEQQPLLGTESGADWDFNPDPDVLETLEETERQDEGSRELAQELSEYSAVSPQLSADDLDADWERGEAVGEEAVGGTVATPDQDVVDELGEAVGITYQDDEPLRTEEKLERRDRNRWELNPASKEDE